MRPFQGLWGARDTLYLEQWTLNILKLGTREHFEINLEGEN